MTFADWPRRKFLLHREPFRACVGRKRVAFRPALEVLEDRQLLSAGQLDPGFGSGGKVLTDFAGRNDTAAAIVRQGDGKLVVAGSSVPVSGTLGDLALARTNVDGSLDTAFGTAGLVVTDFAGQDDRAASLLLQPDGKLIVAGDVFNGNSQDFALARYNADGTLDATFGTGGKVTTDFLGQEDRVAGAALYPDGRIVVVGSSMNLGNNPPTTDFAVARYNADGSLDGTFGLGGQVLTDSGLDDEAAAVVLQPDGRIVLAGTSRSFIPDGTGTDFEVLRYSPDGRLDPTFGGPGLKVFTDFGTTFQATAFDTAHAVTLYPDGRILVAGQSNGDFALARYFANGNLDLTFGSAGRAKTGFVYPDLSIYGTGDDAAYAVILQNDGRIVAAGTSSFGHPPTSDIVLARFDPDGVLDPTFGTGGQVTTDFTTPTPPIPRDDQGAALLVQPDGRLVVAGSSAGSIGTQHDVALARYLADTPLSDANQGFVNRLYLDLLVRPAEPGGLAYYSNRLASGAVTRDGVALEIQASSEYRNRLIQSLYGSILNRPVDPAGASAFAAFFAQGGTIATARAILFGTDEYFTHAGGTNGGFLMTLYRDVFSRSLDPDGAMHWATVLRNFSRTQVASFVQSSPEGNQDLVQGLYRQFLHRPADAEGLSFFVQALQKGAREETVLAGLVSADEYLARP